MLPEIKTRINVGKKVGLIGLTIALIVAFSLGFSIRSISLAQNETSLGVFLQALEIVKSVFVDKDISNTKLVYGAIKGMLESTEDPYTRFLEPKAFLDMTTRMEGQFFGVGIQIGMKKSRITVIAPIEGTPAARAKIKALDVIVSIDGFPTKGLSLEEAVSKIRGERGTKVLLEIEREGLDNNLKVSLVRDSIKIKSVTKVEMIDDTNKIGYIQLATFESRTSTEEISDALADLNKKGMKALILDLRNNGGGLLDQAISIASLFMKNGLVVSTTDRNGHDENFPVVDPEGTTYYDKPLVVLINGASASASEILAGAIKDNSRGVLIGTKSFGKASVQAVRKLSDGSAILVTTAKYHTPSGTDITKKGIEPTLESIIPTETIKLALEEDYVYNAKDDTQLQTAIKYLNGKVRISR
jgi:carboxyl-terminal processing protease